MLRDENGVWIHEKMQLHQLAFQYFKNLYSASSDAFYPYPFRNMFPVLTNDQVAELEKNLLDDEIKNALFQMGALKAPGPDGVHALFFQIQWPMVGKQICNFIQGVFNGDPTPPDLNNTLIVPIPKGEKPELIMQFRPISLCNVLQKLISKVVVNHLKNIMPTLVSPN